MQKLGEGLVRLLALSSVALPARRIAWPEVMQTMVQVHCKLCRPPQHGRVPMFLPDIKYRHDGQVSERLARWEVYHGLHRVDHAAKHSLVTNQIRNFIWIGQVGGRLARWELYHDLHRVEHAAKRGPCSRSLQAASSDWRQPGYHVLNAHLPWLLPSLLQAMRCLNAVWEPQVCAWTPQPNKLLEQRLHAVNAIECKVLCSLRTCPGCCILCSISSAAKVLCGSLRNRVVISSGRL